LLYSCEEDNTRGVVSVAAAFIMSQFACFTPFLERNPHFTTKTKQSCYSLSKALPPSVAVAVCHLAPYTNSEVIKAIYCLDLFSLTGS